MLDIAHLTDLMKHAAWADARLFEAWGKAPDPEDLELRQRQAHITATQEFFLKVLRGEDDLPWAQILSGEIRAPWLDLPIPSFAVLHDWSRATHAQLADFLAKLDPDAAGGPVAIPWFPGCEIPVAEALVQVAMHTQHHRGQMMTRLKQIGGTPVDVDYIIWLWQQRPVPEW